MPQCGNAALPSRVATARRAPSSSWICRVGASLPIDQREHPCRFLLGVRDANRGTCRPSWIEGPRPEQQRCIGEQPGQSRGPAARGTVQSNLVWAMRRTHASETLLCCCNSCTRRAIWRTSWPSWEPPSPSKAWPCQTISAFRACSRLRAPLRRAPFSR